MANAHAAQLFNLDDRVAVVTGASSGLGRQFALALAKSGATVAVCARRQDRLTALVKELEQLGAKATAVQMDVCDRSSVGEAFKKIESEIGTADILVNNAGVSAPARAIDISDKDWNWVVDTDLNGAWMVAQTAAQQMAKAEKAGSIINVTSIIASGVGAGLAPYAAAKAGLKQVSKCLALEWARYGIRVNCIAPGYFSTEMNDDYLASEDGQKIRENVPSRKFGDPGDLDGALLLLASDAGKHMTGTEIAVDGGHLCRGI
ncbi:MAG: SDR family NAD(P)-dependent oxidoreductase [Panacagrimonas sp.]